MELERAGRPSPVAMGLTAAAALAAAVAGVCVFIAVAFGVGWVAAAGVFVAYAVLIGLAMYGWHRFSSRLR